jgi:hypothetical protein
VKIALHLLILGAAIGAPVCASAQPAADARPLRRLEVVFGAGWLGGAGLGNGDASLRARGGGEFALFSTDSRFAGAPVLEARIAYALNRRYGVEARFGFSRPELRSSISGDVEGAPPISVAERVDQYAIDGAAIVMLDGMRLGRVIPFLSVGAGYLRQLHEGRTLIEEGTVYHAGGGVKHWLFVRERGFLKAAGLRGDARVYILSGGIAQEDRPRPHGAASGSVFVTF